MTIEVTAKKVDDAIKQGLEQLGATLDDVNVEVIDAGGLFRKARVRLTLNEPEKEEPKKDEPKKAEPKKEAPKAEPKAEVKEKPAAAKKPSAEKQVKNAQAPSAAAKKESSEKQQDQKQQKSLKEEKPQKAKPQKAAAKKSEDPTSTQDTDTSAPVISKPAKAKRPLTAEDREAAAHALEFVKKTVELMGFGDVTVVPDEETGEHIDITAPQGDDSLIIGRHGETLSALTYLAETCARAEKCRINLVVDCNGYRARRAASLTSMARRRAHECAAKRRRIKLEPMDRIDRRTVHCALADDAYVTTESDGKEPYRCVVIIPKAGEREPDARRDRKDRRDRRDRGAKPAAPQKRPVFDMMAHGKVGHIDEPAEAKEEKEEE